MPKYYCQIGSLALTVWDVPDLHPPVTVRHYQDDTGEWICINILWLEINIDL